MRTTTRGSGLLAGAATLLAAGFTFGYPELALLGAVAAAALAVAVLHALWQPWLRSTRTVEPDRVGRGEPCTVTLTVHNGDRLRPASVVAEDQCGGRPVPVPVLRLRPGRDTTVRYPVPTGRRGVVPIGPLRITRRDPLGLVRLVRSHPDTARVWVHPRVHPMAAVPAGVTRSVDGRFDRVPHGSITFDSLRAYVVGDELRRVHWRTSARIGDLMVREHADTSVPRIVVLLDNRADAHPGVVDGVADTFESACEAAASVVAAADRADLPVTLLLMVDDAESPGAAPPSADRLDGGAASNHLDRLAAADLRELPNGEEALRAVTGQLRRRRLGDTLVFLTGPDAVGLGEVGALRRACPLVVVGVFGPPGTPTQGRGGLAGVLVINAVDGADFAAEWDGVRRW